MPWLPSPGHKNVGCNCDAVNDHGSSDLDLGGLGLFKIPLTFSSFVAFALFFLSCHIDCMHWKPYWRWRDGGGLSGSADSLLNDQPVMPMAVVAVSVVVQPSDGPDQIPTENPLSLQPMGQTSASSGEALGGDPDAAAPPWMLPTDQCCVSQFTVWGIASPQTNLRALRQRHEDKHRTSAADQGQGDGAAAAMMDESERFFPPTVAGAAAFKQCLQQARASEGNSMDKKRWARAGCALACNWIRLHQTVASAFCLLASFWIGDSSNLFLLLLSSWILTRINFSPLCTWCWCAPAGRCRCTRAPADPPCCSWRCSGSYFGIWLACNILIPPPKVWVMAIGCQTSCSLTGWLPGSNQMERPLEKLFAPEYYGLYRDFLGQGFTQPCVLAGAISQLVGPGGAVREALEENHRHWHIDISDTDEMIAETQGWILRHGTALRSAVATRCETMPDGCLGDASCLTASCAAGERCEQGSLRSTCVSSADPCGCTEGFGWSTPHRCCDQTSSTTQREADACVAGTLGVPLGVACDATHYDACGCSPGSGWRSSGACCSSSGSSSASELEVCRANIERLATAPHPGLGPRC